ncbi:unnamed protein product [Linum trigynum]|uniref:Uncharacterized protein n=1 Tax=Linum trigynum TaxID=586398 RepID=A0AAV2GQK8_9ROSI
MAMEEKQRHSGGEWRRTSGQGGWRFEEQKKGVEHENAGAEALGRRGGGDADSGDGGLTATLREFWWRFEGKS